MRIFTLMELVFQHGLSEEYSHSEFTGNIIQDQMAHLWYHHVILISPHIHLDARQLQLTGLKTLQQLCHQLFIRAVRLTRKGSSEEVGASRLQAPPLLLSRTCGGPIGKEETKGLFGYQKKWEVTWLSKWKGTHTMESTGNTWSLPLGKFLKRKVEHSK